MKEDSINKLLGFSPSLKKAFKVLNLTCPPLQKPWQSIGRSFSEPAIYQSSSNVDEYSEYESFKQT